MASLIDSIKVMLAQNFPRAARKYRRAVQSLLSLIPDGCFIRITYWLRLGRWPNLSAPQRFTEKLQWMKIYGNLECLGKYVDKLTVRDYVAEKIGETALVPLIECWKDPDSIKFDELPARFVLKATHGSGFNIIVTDKSTIDTTEVQRKLKDWLALDYSIIGRERQYKYIEHRILCEQYLEHSALPYDYKVFCVNGIPKIIQVLLYDGHKITGAHYDTTWHKLSINREDIEDNKNNIPRPSVLERMLDYAFKLSAPFPFVRVDFYVIENRIYFSELTFTPTNGLIKFIPDEVDYTFCSFDLTNKKTVL